MKTNQTLILSIAFLFLPLTMVSSDEVIRGVRYLMPNGLYSEVSDLHIQNGIFAKINESKQKENIRYVLPSFCDGYVTLGVDATGGQNDNNGIQKALKSFLFHGFTHIQSVGDGPWIHKIKSEIDSGKIIGPKITIANRPIIPKSSEVKDVSDLLFFQAPNRDSTLEEFRKQIVDSQRTLHIFNRYNKDEVYSFDSLLLNQMESIAKTKNRFITIHSFADRIAILDALISGNRYLAHPILFEMQNEITRQHLEELNLIPLLNVYRNLHFNDSKDEDGILELEILRKKSKFFQEHYGAFYETYLKLEIEETELETRKLEYKSYLKFLQKNPILFEKIILGSGAGNRLSFPGVSGIQELKIFANILKPKESFFRIPTQNSCAYLGGAYEGLLAVGKEANLLILKENPVKNLDTLFEIEQVFQLGKPVQWNTPVKKIPKKRR